MSNTKEWYNQATTKRNNTFKSFKDRDRLFLTQKVSKFHNLLKDFINNQNQSKHEITIFCDYDTDGACSAKIAYESLMLAGMKSKNVHVMPDNRIKGFGLNGSYVEDIINAYPNTGMIMTTDNGTGFKPEEIQDIDAAMPILVITDHHPQSLEDYNTLGAYNNYLINPNQYDSNYPFTGLSGTGVVWKLFQAYFYLEYQSNPKQAESKAKSFFNLMPYVALSVLSDHMPFEDENMDMVKQGLDMINNNKAGKVWSVLKHDLINNYDKNAKMTEKSFSWTIAPLINADSRINLDPYTVLFALVPAKREEFVQIAPRLNQLRMVNVFNIQADDVTEATLKHMVTVNELRKKMVNEIKRLLLHDESKLSQHMLLIDDSMLSTETKEEYYKVTDQREHINLSSIAGIIAGKLEDKTKYPVLVIALQEYIDDNFRYLGSARAPEDFDLMRLNQLDELKLNGHEQASGVALNVPGEEDVFDVMKKMNQIIDQLYTPRKVAKTNAIPIEELSIDYIHKIKNLGPFGPGFEEPKFRLNADFYQGSPYHIHDFHSSTGKYHAKITADNYNYEIMIWNVNDNPELEAALNEYNHNGSRFAITLVNTAQVGKFKGNTFPQITASADDVDVINTNNNLDFDDNNDNDLLF